MTEALDVPGSCGGYENSYTRFIIRKTKQFQATFFLFYLFSIYPPQEAIALLAIATIIHKIFDINSTFHLK